MSLADFDFTGFWSDTEYSAENYVDAAPSDAVVAAVERALGYRLPAAYVELAGLHNGGVLARDCHRTPTRTTWAPDHVMLSGIYSIGDARPNSLLGAFGSQFWMDEWGYPPIGVYFADCPSGGHDMICLDYRACGPQGEPAVVHVDEERDYAITPLAPDFEAFLRGLEDESAFEDRA